MTRMRKCELDGANIIADDLAMTNGCIQFLIEETISLTGKEFYRALVKNISTLLGVNYVFVSKCANKESTKVRTLAFWERNKYADNIEFDLDGTPCKDVISGKFCCYDDNIIDLYPSDVGLVNYDARSYMGVPIYNSNNLVIGHLAILHTEPYNNFSQHYSLLRMFAMRAGTELERMEYEEKLKQNSIELQQAFTEIQKLQKTLEKENLYLKEEIKYVHNFEEIIGQSDALKEVLKQADMVATTNSTVLIRGETGTGKELVARAIHNHSQRSERALVKVNCAAIPSGLIESELFGHEKGAFTGALSKKTGKFELADGGTIFLDELGDLPLDAQAKLLRVLQEKEIERVGGTKTRIVDVRVIAATNRDLETAVEEGKFRADLYYRLNVYPIVIPSLRDRKEDIALLAMFFMHKYSNSFGKNLKSIRAKDLELLKNYSWPGNIRELNNVIERAVIITTGDDLKLDNSIIELLSKKPPKEEQAISLEDVEREHMKKVLARTKWQIHGENGAAKLLGMNPSTLRSRMAKLGLKKVTEYISQ